MPAPLRYETSYLFARAQYLRRNDKPVEAAQVVADVGRDPVLLVDGDEWWVERRLIARKLLDQGDAKAAYEVVRNHAAASTEKHIEAEFHAGWIALRFLDDQAAAGRHFADAARIAVTPISIARTAYWQGRAAEAAGQADAARSFYERGARYGITYYGAYNAGGPNVSKWIRAYGDPRAPGVDIVDWIERIPFHETRDYVQRALEGLQVYRYRFGQRDSARADGAAVQAETLVP